MSTSDSRIQCLDWDTQQFGFPVAKLLPTRLIKDELSELCRKLIDDGVRLVYWASDANDAVSQSAAQARKGVLVDKKITYVKTLTKQKPISTVLRISFSAPHTQEKKSTHIVKVYTETSVSKDLKMLALMAGEYSRFKTDPKMPPHLFEKIYTQWITNCVNHTRAKRLIVIRDADAIIAMATLGEHQGRGDIGLLAVAPNARGQGYGMALMRAAEQFFIESGYSMAQVVTQQANEPACRLYEKAGYVQEKRENFYHFWL